MKLENSEVPDVFGYFLNCLHARRPSPDNCHPFVRELYGSVRPPRGVKGLSLERFDTLDSWQSGFREIAHGRNQEPAFVGTPILQLDCPSPSIIVIESGFDFTGELDIFEQIEFIGYVLQVSQGLRLPGEMLGPVPLVEQFLGKRICVRVAFRIEPGAGVAIPVPGASHSRSSFEDPDRHAKFPQSVQLVQARDPSPYHDCIVVKTRV